MTEDGSVHHIESPMYQYLYNLLQVVCGNISVSSKDNSGSYSLHIIRLTANSETELVVSSENCEGRFDSTKGCPHGYSNPKVAISPQGNYVATLDFMGCADVFKLDVEHRSLSFLSFAAKQQEEKLDKAAHKFRDVEKVLVLIGRGRCLKFCQPVLEG